MDYELLSSVFYKDAKQYEALYNTRFNSESTFKLPIDIHGNQAFVMITKGISIWQDYITSSSSKLPHLLSATPKIMLEHYKSSCVIEEIMLTNDIEGVYSSRKEITAIYNNANRDKDARFRGLVEKYKRLADNHDIPLSTCEDIRALYDEIVLPEIEADNTPDGKTFRKETTAVHSATDKVKHTGIYPEGKIIDYMDRSLALLHDNKIPSLIRIAVFHYLFGYIHPFYDGNGRMSRFISSYLLRDAVSDLVSFRISYIIKDNKNAYYKAFDDCNNEKNKGDLTPFVLMFLEVIANAMRDLGKNMREKTERFLFVWNKVLNLHFPNVLCVALCNVFVLDAMFGGSALSMPELKQHTGKSENAVRRAIQAICNLGIDISKQRDGKKFVYSVDLNQIEQL